MRPRLAAGNKTRDKLLEHALRLFADRGYAATSIREIIEAAEVTQPTLYYYFSNKQSLFTTLVEQHYAASQDLLTQELGSAAGCVSKLKLLLNASFLHCCRNPLAARLMFQTYFGPKVAEIERVLERVTKQRFEMVVDIMKAGLASGELRQSDPQFLALGFCCLMDQMLNLLSRKKQPQKYLTAELADSLLQLFLFGAGGVAFAE
jgi:AcrR family transcriptional regulator